MKKLTSILNINTLVVTIIVLLFSNCEDKSYTECKYFGLCDSSLYCSFTIDGNELMFEQSIEYNNSFAMWIDTPFIQKGYNLKSEISFNSTKYDGVLLSLSKSFATEFYTPCFRYDSTFSDSLRNTIVSLPLENYLSMFNDTLKPTNKYSLFTKNPYYDPNYYEFSDSLIEHVCFTGGVSIYLFYNEKYWSSVKNENAAIVSGNLGNITPFLKVNSITHYKEDFFIIKGNFVLEAFYPLDYEETQVERVILENGKFNLFVNIQGIDRTAPDDCL